MKLNQLEERILRELLATKKQNNFKGLSFSDVDDRYVIEAVGTLAQKGLVKSANTLSSANAMLTSDGLYYFEMLEKDKYGEYYEKIKLIEEKITETEHMKESTNDNAIQEHVFKIFSLFEDELLNFSGGFRTLYEKDYDPEDIDFKHADYIYDLGYLIDLLRRIKADIMIEAKKAKTEQQKIEIHNNPNFHNENNFNATIDITTTINNVQNASLSPEEKEELSKLILELETAKSTKNKQSAWEKAKSILKWVTEKGVEMAGIVLPFVAKSLNG